MAGVTTCLSITTLGANSQVCNQKDTNWQDGLKNKIQPWVAYKKGTTLAKTNIDLK
jgi:hypothetical protein